jgi:3'(2'), 5'-bisphosphate nucleotidase
MSPEPLSPLLDACAALARAAGARVLEHYATACELRRKADDSPVTAADEAAHEHIVAGLSALTPQWPVLSEEDCNIPWATRSRWTRYWLVDPLDGTREFIKRNGQFTVNIALIDAGLPILGVVHAPVDDRSWLAAQGCGAWLETQGQRSPLRTRRVPALPALPIYVVSQSHRDARLEALLRAAPAHEALSVGSSLKFCRVAEGQADFYPRTGPISEWDSAAGQCVVEQAGGRVIRLPERTRLAYNEKDSLLNPRFAVIGDPAYDWSPLLAALS